MCLLLSSPLTRQQIALVNPPQHASICVAQGNPDTCRRHHTDRTGTCPSSSPLLRVSSSDVSTGEDCSGAVHRCGTCLALSQLNLRISHRWHKLPDFPVSYKQKCQIFRLESAIYWQHQHHNIATVVSTDSNYCKLHISYKAKCMEAAYSSCQRKLRRQII